jgi:hypothetical protein
VEDLEGLTQLVEVGAAVLADVIRVGHEVDVQDVVPALDESAPGLPAASRDDHKHPPFALR